MTQVSDAKQRILDTAAELGLSMTSKFVPWSQSRNKAEKSPSLNWLITIDCNHNGPPRHILTTDYMAGSGNCPAYKASVKEMGRQNSLMRSEAITIECETGKLARVWGGGGVGVHSDKPLPPPDLADVLYSLASDADVLDAGGFEEWASNYGYDTDSRKAEAVYRACLDIALKLREAIGEAGLTKLREACQDY